MRFQTRRAAICASVVVALSSEFVGGVEAFPVTHRSIDTLVANADLVLTGSVTTVREGPPAVVSSFNPPLPGHVMQVEIVPDQVLKGTESGQLIHYEYVRPDPPYDGIDSCVLMWSGRYAVFFLKTAPSHSYVGVEACQPTAAAMHTTMPQGGAAIDKVATAVGAIVGALNVAIDQRVEAIDDLQGVTSDTATAALRSALGDANATVRYRAAGCLLRRNNAEALPVVIDALTHPVGRSAGDLDYLRAGLRWFTDAAAVDYLPGLVDSPDVQTRRAALQALRSVHSLRAVPLLARALGDSDAEVEFWATSGLSEVVAGQSAHRGRLEDFTSGQGGAVLDFWQRWARERGLLK